MKQQNIVSDEIGNKKVLCLTDRLKRPFPPHFTAATLLELVSNPRRPYDERSNYILDEGGVCVFLATICALDKLWHPDWSVDSDTNYSSDLSEQASLCFTSMDHSSLSTVFVVSMAATKQLTPPL